VTELERRLVALGRELSYPREPELAPRVLARLERRPFPCRSVALAFVVLAAALAAALAVPQARTALLRWFHLGGATVVRVETLPPAVERARSGGLGAPVSLAEAERRVGFELALPPFKGRPPSRAYVVGDSLATVVVRAYGVRTLLSEFPSFGRQAVKKLAADGTVIDPVRIDGRPGLWIAGHPHTFSYFDRETGYRQRPVRVHGNVLLWVRGGLTLRLEGALTKAQALGIARLTR
jgi:hypothetical protein